MAGMLGGKSRGNTNGPPNYTHLQLQTSTLGLPIAFGYGKNRATINLIDYTDFKQFQVKQGGGKAGALGGGCFPWGTPIITPFGPRPIETLQVGAPVVSFDDVGDLHNDQISETHDHADELHPLLEIGLEGRHPFVVTPNHFLLTPENLFREAHGFNVGDHLVKADGTLALIVSVRELVPQPVRNLSVARHRTFIADGIRVHNLGGGKPGQTQYSATILAAIGEGPIQGIDNAWQDRTKVKFSSLGYTLFPGTATQAPWGYMLAAHPNRALTYAYTSYLAKANANLGGSPNVPSQSFEVIWPFSGTYSWTPDANPADIVVDYLTNPQQGLGLSVAQIGDTSFYRTYCQAVGILLSPLFNSREQVTAVIDRIAQITNSWIFWSGDKLKFVPLGDQAIANGQSFTVVVNSNVPPSPGPYTFTGVPTVTADGGVTYFDGTPLTPVGGTPAQGQYNYVAGVWTFAAADAGVPIIVTYTYSYAGPTYTPATLPVFDFDYTNIIADPGKPPIAVEITDPADAYNHLQITIKDRSLDYNDNILEFKDQSLIGQYGVIDAPAIQGYEIADPQVAQTAVNLIGQRYANILNTYKWKASWAYVAAEPGDIVTLTDPNIGISKFPVRIREVSEDEKGNLSFTAENFAAGVASTVAQAGSSTSPTRIAAQNAPGNVNQPIVLEPPPGLVTLSAPAIWIFASGGANWGSARVWISFDGVNYTAIGIIQGPCLQGVLTAPLPSHADPDLVDTLSLDLSESLGVMPTDATHADADADRSLAYIVPQYTTTIPNAGELLAYGAVAVTGTYTDNLTYLRRGQIGTAIGAHANGDFFYRIDQAAPGLFQYQLPQGYVGGPISLKFTSINTFGNQEQDLSTVTAYTYTPTGVAFAIAPPTGVALAASTTSQPDGTVVQSMTLSWIASVGPSLGGYDIQFSTDGGTTWPINASAGATATSFVFAPAIANTSYTARIRARSQNGVAIGSWVSAGPVSSGAGSGISFGLRSYEGNLSGKPTAGQELFSIRVTRKFTLPVNLASPESEGGCELAPTGSVTCSIQKNGSSIGTMNIAAAATDATFTFAAPVTFDPANDDVFAFFAPAVADATLAGLMWGFIGTLVP